MKIKIHDNGIIYTVSLESVIKSLKKLKNIKPYKGKPRDNSNNVWKRIKKEII